MLTKVLCSLLLLHMKLCIRKNSRNTNHILIQDSSGSASDISGANATALSIITLVGAIASLVGVVLTMIIHGCIRKLRTAVPSQVLMNLCAALMFSLILFILASQASGDATQCRIWAIGLQYFWLSAMAWMLVQGINLHGLIVIVLGLQMERRLKLYYVGGWGKTP